MVSSRDSRIIELWLERQASPHTRGCYRRDVARLLVDVPKSLSRIALGDLQCFAQSLIQAGLAPISRARTLAVVKSLFGFCQRMRYVSAIAAEGTQVGYILTKKSEVQKEDSGQKWFSHPHRSRWHMPRLSRAPR